MIPMVEKVMNLIKEPSYLVPKLFFFHLKELNVSEKECLLLIYLMNEIGDFNPKEIENNLQIPFVEVMDMIQSLTEKGFLRLEMRKVGNLRTEFINLDGLYQKLALLIVNEKAKEEPSSNLYDLFEKEFGRPISPMEYEIINAWLESNFTEELILMALKEATYNGVSSLRYIDKILHDWKKKGVKNKQDVEEEKKRFQTQKIETKEIIDYDWLNDDE